MSSFSRTVFAKNPAPKYNTAVVRMPTTASSASARWNTLLAPAKSPVLNRSETMREMAVGMPEEEMMRSHE